MPSNEASPDSPPPATGTTGAAPAARAVLGTAYTADLLHQGTAAAILVNLVTAAGIVAMSWHPALERGLAIWLGSVILLMGLRVADSLHFRARRDRHPPAHFLARVAALVVASALMWSIFVVLFFNEVGIIERSLIAMALSGIASGASLNLAALPWLARATVGCFLLPVGLLLLMGSRQEMAIGIMAMLFIVVLFTWISRYHGNMVDLKTMSRINRSLMVDATRQRKRTESLNRQLKSAQVNLLSMNQQLERRVRQRTTMLQQEVNERQGYQKQLEQLLTRDPLTGITNRNGVTRSLALAIDSALETGHRIAVLFVDLDRFKEVNDGLGHHTGDQVLKIVAARLSNGDAACRSIARWGGDEFVVVRDAPAAGEPSHEAFASLLIERLSEVMAVDELTLRVGASVGIALYPEHGTDPETLLRHADIAVYEAKAAGRSTFRLFESVWEQRARDRHDMLQALKLAVADDELTLVYQPIVDARTGETASMEALLRWEHPRFGSVSPAVFVPLAEDSGLMVALGNWVLRQACIDSHALAAAGSRRVSVNVSVHQFAQADFVAQLDELIAETGIAPQWLELELTETVYARDANLVMETTQAIRSRQVRIAIDDFGTGYSSLAYLQRFPVDVLKVDRSFVQSLDSGGDTIISAVASLAVSLNLELVFEGVETEDQLTRVMALGTHYVQGFHFGRPMPLEDALVWLGERRRGLPAARTRAPDRDRTLSTPA